MRLEPYSITQLAVLTSGYWLLDVAIRRELLCRLIAPLGRAAGLALAALGLLLLTALLRWEHVPQADVVRLLSLGLSLLLTWKVVTMDIDPVSGTSHAGARLLLLGACIGEWWSPAFVLVPLFLLTRPFSQWRHHAILPMRALLITAAFLCVTALGGALPSRARPFVPTAATLLFLLLTLHASHYFSAGLAKLQLGPRWSSWLLENRLHFMAANAYAWGWLRFLPWPLWRRVIKAIAVTEQPLLAATLAIEVLAPLALLSPRAALIACACWSAFNLGVFLMCGLCFWDWVGANLLLALAVLLLPAASLSALFGWQAVVACAAFIALFPLRHRLWDPIPLAWWETPLTGRMHWLAHGASGATYEVYNDFMCPNERLYGTVHALFMAPLPLLTYELGIVWDAAHRDAVCAAGPDRQRLDALRGRFGAQPRHDALAENHINYLHRFFSALNQGARKHLLPPWLRWLKAPGGHLFSWGDLPAFRGQEQVVRVSLRYREQYFDGEALVLIRDELVAELVIDEDSARRPCEREPSARRVERLTARAFWSREAGA